MTQQTTISLCPTCYMEIPAKIDVGESAVMTKECPVHGLFESVVEPDAGFYSTIKAMSVQGNQPATIYFEITGECNTACRYCYASDYREPPMPYNEIMARLKVLSKYGCSFNLTGGEPTTHPQFMQIAKELAGYHMVTTNGLLFSRPDFLDVYLDCGVSRGDMSPIILSLHAKRLNSVKDYFAKMHLIRLLRERKLKMPTVFATFDNLEQIPGIIEDFKANSDVIESLRLRCASRIGASNSPSIFASDGYKYLKERYNVELLPSRMAFVNMKVDGYPVMLINWYDAGNIDIQDMHQLPPFYVTKTGQVMTVNHALVVNEGITKGWINGRRITLDNP